jgi:hypothetical protein
MSQEEVLELALAGHNVILTRQCATGKTYLFRGGSRDSVDGGGGGGSVMEQYFK